MLNADQLPVSKLQTGVSNLKGHHRRFSAKRWKKSRLFFSIVTAIILLGLIYIYLTIKIVKNHAIHRIKSDISTDEALDLTNNVNKRDTTFKFGHGVKPQVIITNRNRETMDGEDRQNTHPLHVLTAYLEAPNLDEWDIQPLPNRSRAKRENLRAKEYHKLNSCSKLPEQWPIDDTPADQDPFLPWIHDVFPTSDGKYIQFVAQNKRRCNAGYNSTESLKHFQPQAALFQSAPVQRILEGNRTRYRLTSYEDADPDSFMTRFICRFKPGMEETLSTFNFDYDWASYRKRYPSSFDRNHGNIKSPHSAQLIFMCPVPLSLQETIRTGRSVKDDYASMFLDLVPIRTPTRYGIPHQFFQPKYQEFEEKNATLRFDAVKAYGVNHILPLIEDSGRWENIPICKPSLMTYENQNASDLPINNVSQKKHRLVSCVWSSAGYFTRGNHFAVNDGQRRLLEWIVYKKIIGFDHFYVYDNSAAYSNAYSLKPVADLFPDDVTYIRWPARICNNNLASDANPGERSSQYASESSCRLRFGPHTDWIGQFDPDEYLVPMGKHGDVLELINDLEREDVRALSFGSYPARPRRAFLEPIRPIDDPEICEASDACFHPEVLLNYTLLQAYNCEYEGPGQKTDLHPAEKQIYRPDYVLQHFVHYSTVTTLLDKNRTEYEKEGFPWQRRGKDPRQRFANELTEGLMIHAKAVSVSETAGQQKICGYITHRNTKLMRRLCRFGVPWPQNVSALKGPGASEDGWLYNCYLNDKVEYELVPKVEAALHKIQSSLNRPTK